jgi:hypothetical protein
VDAGMKEIHFGRVLRTACVSMEAAEDKYSAELQKRREHGAISSEGMIADQISSTTSRAGAWVYNACRFRSQKGNPD